MQALFTPFGDLHVIAPARHAAPEPARAAYRHARGRYIDLMTPAVERAGQAFEATADVEDWHENVARLLAALDAGMDVHVIARTAHRTGEIVPVASFGAPFDPTRPTVLLGAEPRSSVLFGTDPTQPVADLNIVWPRRSCARAANAYAGTATFARHAGRRVAVCDIPGAGPAGDQVAANAPGTLAHTLAAWAADGPVDGLLKVVAQIKYGPLVPIQLPAGADLRAARQAVVSAMSYDLLDLEGQRGAVLLQDRIPMADEYRVFVVDQTPVTGAGCIEHHTPCDRLPGHAFDPQVRTTRGAGAVRRDDARVAAYRDVAGTVTAALARELPELRDYTLDLAFSGDTPVVVEFNPLAPSGLYACGIDALIRAVRDAGWREGARQAA